MADMSPVAIAITAVTAAASLLSLIGSGFILVCYAILPLDNHFRHVLILNLATSDFLNSLNNSVGGLYILSYRKGLDPGRACVFNGFVGQVTVQATDCAILAIAVTTVHTITGRRISAVSSSDGRWQYRRTALLTCAIWALPFFTGFLALGMRWYAPATGDWCWIEAKPVYLRYVLTHGWRFLFIIIEIALYVYLDVYLRRHYRAVAHAITPRGPGSHPSSQSEPHRESTTNSPFGQVLVTTIDPGEKSTFKSTSDATSSTITSPNPNRGSTTGLLQQTPSRGTFWSRITGLRGTNRMSSSAFSPDARYQAIQRVLLLNAYPLAYIILWLPGIANRLIEATGRECTATQFLQATTQLVGLANALTYGWNEKVAKQLRERFSKR
ncbi:hypothetical protein AX14_013036 [Amanita brunnescens Koide BX004]|nr:hypothetical protein AX14_013036 [Amanita brunnescens Koide BX004]